MRRTVKLTERDLSRIVRRVIIEDNKQTTKVGDSNNLKNQKASQMEIAYKNTLSEPFYLNAAMFLVQCISVLILLLSFLGNCFCNEKSDKNDKRQLFELRSEVNTSKA